MKYFEMAIIIYSIRFLMNLMILTQNSEVFKIIISFLWVILQVIKNNLNKLANKLLNIGI